MYLTKIQLSNYRNFSALSLDFERKGAVITGVNGSGKTNLLEGLYYLAFGRSFRTVSDSEIIRFGENYFRIAGEFIKQEKKCEITAASDKNNKIFKIANQNIERLSELFSYLQTVYFSPGDIQIIGGSPAVRRTFLDQAVSQYDQEYLFLLRQYRQILKQRNALLKSDFQTTEKKTWDNQFIESSGNIYIKRLEYFCKFIPLFRKYYKDLFHLNEGVDIKYVFSHDSKADSFSKDSFIQILRKLENQEKLLQRTLIGPHLDDFEFQIDGKKARSFASQGQMRSLSIITRITQALMISNEAKDYPVLMFDDVLAELDSGRRQSILTLLRGKHQVLIATPDIEVYRSLDLPVITLKDYVDGKETR